MPLKNGYNNDRSDKVLGVGAFVGQTVNVINQGNLGARFLIINQSHQIQKYIFR
jgi:hypothetical protein